MRNLQFINEGFYHIFSRGVEKRNIFLEEKDYQRFYTSLYLFNDETYHATTGEICTTLSTVFKETKKRERKPLVYIRSFCLLPNHFHLLLEQTVEGGITKFMHRLLMGYAKYFNKKYERKGRLYEGEFKAISIQRDAHFVHLPRYIHLNALDLTELLWRKGKIEDWRKALEYLEKYPWSSHHVYMRKPQLFPVIETKEMPFTLEEFKTKEHYIAFLKEWSERDLLFLEQYYPLQH